MLVVSEQARIEIGELLKAATINNEDYAGSVIDCKGRVCVLELPDHMRVLGV